jgi:hypothetical protein
LLIGVRMSEAPAAPVAVESSEPRPSNEPTVTPVSAAGDNGEAAIASDERDLVSLVAQGLGLERSHPRAKRKRLRKSAPVALAPRKNPY